MSSCTTAADKAYQQRSLLGVSRTFALTIPQLPDPLAWVVGNAYLLCRIADTIEDDKFLEPARKREIFEHFMRVLAAQGDADAFSREISPLLARGASAEELNLMTHVPVVLRVTGSMNAVQRASLQRCIRIMVDGMGFYQQHVSCAGLPDLSAMEDYCYCVGGVVGEMLTEIFCDYSGEMKRHQAELLRLSVSFGKGLQMTNILKDAWEDRRRGICWLPQEIFQAAGCDLSALRPGPTCAGYRQGVQRLLGVAGGHLRDALRYTLLIPAHERGLRRFCAWALGMAALTLRRISRNPGFQSGQEVKISRYSVYATAGLSSLLIGNDRALRFLFEQATAALPPPVDPPALLPDAAASRRRFAAVGTDQA